MRTRWTFHECDDLTKAEIEGYWAKKTPRIERLLQTFREDRRRLDISIYRHLRRYSFEGRAVLQLPTRTLVVSASDKNWRALIDELADLLASEIKRHRACLRHDWLYRRKNRRRDELSAAGPLLAHDRSECRRDAFFELLLPMLKPLKAHARRELRLIEQQGTLHRNEITADDVIDEVLLRAWEEFDQRPHGWDIDVWLMGLVDDYFGQLQVRPKTVPLAKRLISPPSITDDDDSSQAIMTMNELLPGEEGGEQWERLGNAEQQDRIDGVLGEMPARQRTAFAQFYLEGFDIGEIAMIQDRPGADVKVDIEAAREALKTLLLGRAPEMGHPAAVPASEAHPAPS